MTSQIPLFKMMIVGPLPWGSGGHNKSQNPVNNHRERDMSNLGRFAGQISATECSAMPRDDSEESSSPMARSVLPEDA